MYPNENYFASKLLTNSIVLISKQFAKIHTSFLINNETILNRTITKLYENVNVNVITAELLFIKTRSTSFYKKHNLKKQCQQM